jgi:hypothetical protein
MSDGEDLNVIRVEVAHHFGPTWSRTRVCCRPSAEPWSR